MTTLLNTIKALEETLLHTDVRSNPAILSELLAEELEEIGVTGNITSREAVVDWLTNKEKDIKWSLSDFQIKQLTPDIVIAMYKAQKIQLNEKSSSCSMRSSIWQLFGEQWKMVFHQGTRINTN